MVSTSEGGKKKHFPNLKCILKQVIKTNVAAHRQWLQFLNCLGSFNLIMARLGWKNKHPDQSGRGREGEWDEQQQEGADPASAGCPVAGTDPFLAVSSHSIQEIKEQRTERAASARVHVTAHKTEEARSE